MLCARTPPTYITLGMHLLPCRYDGRALLDFYKEPDPKLWERPKNAEEKRLEEVRDRRELEDPSSFGQICCFWLPPHPPPRPNTSASASVCHHSLLIPTCPTLPPCMPQLLLFESYRDLVRLMAKGLGEGEGIVFAARENIDIRAAARVAAAAEIAKQHANDPRRQQNAITSTSRTPPCPPGNPLPARLLPLPGTPLCPQHLHSIASCLVPLPASSPSHHQLPGPPLCPQRLHPITSCLVPPSARSVSIPSPAYS